MPDGKGSRMAGLSRNSQPKQGANWHGNQGRRPGPPDFQGRSPYDQQPGMEMMQHHQMGMGDMGAMMGVGQMPGSPGGMPAQQMGFPGSPSKAGAPMGPPPNCGAEPSSSSNAKLASKVRNPAKPWADVQDSHHDYQDLQALWGKQNANNMGDFNSPQPKHSGQAMKGSKGGRGKEGKGADMDQGKGGRGQQQDFGGQQSKWVPTQPDPPSKGGKGQQRQPEWAPKPVPAPPDSHMSIAGGKGRGGGGAPGAVSIGAGAGGGAGSQKPGKTKKDTQMEDWLSLRFAGQERPPNDNDASAGDGWDKDYGDDYYDDDGGDESRRSKRKGKGGKGKGAEKSRDKGKGKGKGKGGGGGFWRASS